MVGRSWNPRKPRHSIYDPLVEVRRGFHKLDGFYNDVCFPLSVIEAVDQLRNTRLVTLLFSIGQKRLRFDVGSQSLGVTVFYNV
jgi:hypothetical protein